MELLPTNMLNYIFKFVPRYYLPIVRLACVRFSKIIQQRRVNVPRLAIFGSIELIKYLLEYKITDLTNSNYIENAIKCSNKNLNKYKFLKYLYQLKIPLSSYCINTAISNEDIEALKLLREWQCPLPNIIWIYNYNEEMIEYIKSFHQNDIIYYDFVKTPDKVWYNIEIKHRAAYNKLFYNLVKRDNLKLIKHINADKFPRYVLEYGLLLAKKYEHRDIIKYLNQIGINEVPKIPQHLGVTRKTENQLKYIFYNNIQSNESNLSHYVVYQMNIELIEILWDLSYINKDLIKIFMNSPFYIINRNISYNELYKFLNHCLKKGIIIDTSYIVTFDNIELCNWCHDNGLKFGNKAYCEAIRCASSRILDWLYQNGYQYNMLFHRNRLSKDGIIPCLIKSGSTKMLRWFMKKENIDFNVFLKEWVKNPNHLMLVEFGKNSNDTDFDKSIINSYLSKNIYLISKYFYNIKCLWLHIKMFKLNN